MTKKKFERKYQYDTLPEQRPNESDVQYYKRLVKNANDRMRRIEESANDPVFGEMKYYAYKNARYDLEHIYGEPMNRFKTKIPMLKENPKEINRFEFHRQMNAVKKFLAAPSSTRSGVVEVYKKRADTINKRFEDQKDYKKLTWKDLADFYQNEKYNSARDDYGSDTIIRALGAVKRVANNPKKIKEAIDGTMRLSKDDTVNEAAKRLIENGIFE